MVITQTAGEGERKRLAGLQIGLVVNTVVQLSGCIEALSSRHEKCIPLSILKSVYEEHFKTDFNSDFNLDFKVDFMSFMPSRYRFTCSSCRVGRKFSLSTLSLQS